MKEQELIDKLRTLKEKHIYLFNPECETNKTCGMAKNYNELMLIIGDFLKTSKFAIEGLPTAEEKYLENTETDIGQVIGVILYFLPYSEMQFVDEVLQLLEELEESERKGSS